MGGKKERCLTGKQINNPLKTDEASIDMSHSQEGSTHQNVASKSAAAKAASLQAIINGVQVDSGKWPQEMFKAVLQRFNRMPRCGWNTAHQIFCKKFQASMSVLDFKKKAREAIVSKNGRPCSIKEFERDPAKRTSTEEVFEDQQSLREANLYLEIKEKFWLKAKELDSFKVDEVERTRKIASAKVDKTLLNTLNRVVGEYASAHRPKDMTDLARILQAAQLCYRDASARPKKPSEWRANIESKIREKSASIALLQKGNAPAKLSEDERKAARKVMRDFGLILNKPKDVTKAVSLLQESIQIYQKKLQVHESRREFRRENQFFELNRRAFYRQLTEGAKTAHEVSRVDQRILVDNVERG